MPDPLDAPVFIVAPPESGAGPVHAALLRSPGVWGLGAAGRAVLDAAPAIDPDAGDRRAAGDATAAEIARIRDELRALALASGVPGRPLDGAPRNSLRVGFLARVFPEARFLYVYRDPRETIAAIDAAWRSGAFVSHAELEGWDGPPWSLVLVPGWSELAGASITRIAAAQWEACTRSALDELEALEPERWSVLDHAVLAEGPESALAGACGFLGLPEPEPGPIPMAEGTGASLARVSEPLESLLAGSVGLAERARDLIARPRSRRPTARAGPESGLASSHTDAFADLLTRTGGSLLAAGGAPGKLACVSAAGPHLETLFRDVPGARAVCTDGAGFAVAGDSEIWTYEADEAGGEAFKRSGRRPLELEPCDLASDGDRIVVAAGDRIVELGAGSGVTLWSTPRSGALTGAWVTGLALAPGAPALATAEPGPFTKRTGIALALDTGEALDIGLRSPRAPRWHDGRLWALDAADGALCLVDLDRGGAERVATVPGFATALAFAGRLAFVATAGERDGGAGATIWVVETGGGTNLARLRFAHQPATIGGLASLGGVRRPRIQAAASSRLARP